MQSLPSFPTSPNTDSLTVKNTEWVLESLTLPERPSMSNARVARHAHRKLELKQKVFLKTNNSAYNKGDIVLYSNPSKDTINQSSFHTPLRKHRHGNAPRTSTHRVVPSLRQQKRKPLQTIRRCSSNPSWACSSQADREARSSSPLQLRAHLLCTSRLRRRPIKRATTGQLRLGRSNNTT